MIVYAIRNDVNEKVYVGQTVVSLRVRFLAHLRSTRDDMPISRAIREIGRDHFRIESLQTCDSQAELNNAERDWILGLGSVEPCGYNVSLGNGRNQETREKISAALKGRKITWGSKIAATRLGQPANANQLRALAEGRSAPHTASQRKRMSVENPRRRLNDSEVREIRRLYATGDYTQERLASMFNVNQTHIGRIVRRVAFSWLED